MSTLGCWLQVRAVFMDDVMQQPDLPELEMVADYETRSLRLVQDNKATIACILIHTQVYTKLT